MSIKFQHVNVISRIIFNTFKYAALIKIVSRDPAVKVLTWALSDKG